MRNKKIAIIAALLLAGLSFAAYRPQDADTPAKNTEVREDGGDPSPETELARWLVREGRLRLRSGRPSSARAAAALAAILDERSEHASIARAITGGKK